MSKKSSTISSSNNVKYKRTDALSLWHQQKSTKVDIHRPLKTRGETRCPGGVSVSCLASRTRHECPRTQRKCIYQGLTLDVGRDYIRSVTATKHQEKSIITLESNPSRGTVLPTPHGKRNKCDKNVKYKRTNALTVAPTKEHDGGHSRTPANQR